MMMIMKMMMKKKEKNNEIQHQNLIAMRTFELATIAPLSSQASGRCCALPPTPSSLFKPSPSQEKSGQLTSWLWNFVIEPFKFHPLKLGSRGTDDPIERLWQDEAILWWAELLDFPSGALNLVVFMAIRSPVSQTFRGGRDHGRVETERLAVSTFLGGCGMWCATLGWFAIVQGKLQDAAVLACDTWKGRTASCSLWLWRDFSTWLREGVRMFRLLQKGTNTLRRATELCTLCSTVASFRRGLGLF